MIRVTKEEAMAIRQMSPDSHVTIVNRQSSHKKYFAEENQETDAILAEMRQQNVIYTAGSFPKPKAAPKKPKTQPKQRYTQTQTYSGGSQHPRREQRGYRPQGGVR